MNNGKYDKMISVIDMEMPNRKPNRIAGYDYSQSGAYFITICTQDRKKILSRISVGTPLPGCPQIPHDENGHPRTGVPTRTSEIARFVGTFKRFCNKEYGSNIWQSRYYDHVIRNQQDYNEVWEYIENNPTKWAINKDKI